jgi:hypothetical protein
MRIPWFSALLFCSLLPAEDIDFARDIQPIFQKSCAGCHGPKAQLGGLRIDAKVTAFKGVSGATIVPGHAKDSSMWQRVAGVGDQARMPMGGKPLPPEQIELIRKWIDAGAVWPDGVGAQVQEIRPHWAYVAPKRPAPPAVADAKWPRTPIDNFIFARMAKEGLTPSTEADRITLLRRASLDLIGLPPTQAEIKAFLKDKSSNAFEKQVDRLLASPHYGERQARIWLDAARYADSDGFEKDKQRWVWFYRDWVIKAHNQDMPYTRFITEQLAGDLMPNATQDQIVATGFLRNSMINEEGGADPEQFRMEAMFDRVDAIGKSMLGVTIACAQCHNHKFDPLTQEEYYKIFAFLNNSHEGSVAVYTPAELQQREMIFRGIREKEEDLRHRTSDWKERVTSWLQKLPKQDHWAEMQPVVEDMSTGGSKYLPQKDRSMLAFGYAPTKHRVKMIFRTERTDIRAVRLELLNDPNLPLGGPGRAPNGSGALTEFEVDIVPIEQPDAKAEKIKVIRATADINLPEAPLAAIFDDKSGKKRVTGPIAYAIDGVEETAWGLDAGPYVRNQPRNAVFLLEKPISNPGGSIITVYLKQNHGGWNSDDNQSNNLGRMRISFSSLENAEADILSPSQRKAASIAAAERSEEQWNALFRAYRAQVPEWSNTNNEIAALMKQHPEGTSQLVLQDRDDMRTSNILIRGDFLKPGKVVEPGVPAFLHSLPKDAPKNRLGLAQWITDTRSPTTARSYVNRVWQQYFGTGLVPSTEDLGKQSDLPSHPELLDWLAVDFMDKGWSMKQLHRIIVTSAVYRQNSKLLPEHAEKDPTNRYLARFPRLRVDAEIVRDIALTVSGLLNPAVGGPSVYSPAPHFLFEVPASYGPKIWNEEKNADRYRRAIYTFRYRSVPYPMLQTFDAPNGDISCVRRPRSNTPLQALTTLNEPLFMETARALAMNTMKEGGKNDAQRLDYAFARCTSRTPDAKEKAALMALFEKQKLRFSGDEAVAKKLAFEDPAKPLTLPKGMNTANAAAWTAIARVLLNLDETISRE